jgi:hypothetical protein
VRFRKLLEKKAGPATASVGDNLETLTPEETAALAPSTSQHERMIPGTGAHNKL